MEKEREYATVGDKESCDITGLVQTNLAFCVEVLENMAFDELLILHGDPDGGEAYGITRSQIFDGDIYILSYIGGGHTSCIDLTHQSENETKQLLTQWLQGAWDYAGNTEYYVDRKKWIVAPDPS